MRRLGNIHSASITRTLIDDSAPRHESVQYQRKALPISLVRRILRRQQSHIYSAFADRFPPKPGDRVLDLGVNGALTRAELHFFEWEYPYKRQIVAAGLEPPDIFELCYPEVRYVQTSREARLPFDDDEFDLVFCSAVVEHVGSRDSQRSFLAELARVARKAFVTTPNRWYPIEVHTVLPLVHYLPTPWYRAVFRSLGFKFFADEENLNLLDEKSLLSITPPGVDARIDHRRFLGFTSNLLLSWTKPVE